MNRFWGIPFLSFHLSNLITSIKTALQLLFDGLTLGNCNYLSSSLAFHG